MIKCSSFKIITPTSTLINSIKTGNNFIFGTIKKFFSKENFNLKKALLVRKVTRYEYEKFVLRPDLTESQLEQYINKKGSNYTSLLSLHQEYMHRLLKIKNAFSKKNIEFKLIQRFNFTSKHVDWADAIFTSGGDGTFLLAARNIKNNKKPVIGINTDPLRSEGFLCLSKDLSSDFDLVLTNLLSGDYKHFWRQRIRITLSGNLEPSFDLYDHYILNSGGEQYQDSLFEFDPMESSPQETNNMRFDSCILPAFSLNEVFIGEKLSARVSFYELSIDESAREKQKSSGLMVCPGTGSTSWYFNSNNVTKSTVKQILQIAKKYKCITNETLCVNEKLQPIVDEFNSALVFDATEMKMAYSVRDPLTAGVYQVSSEPRGFCSSLKVKSRMYDACVVIDGSLSYPFNDGSELKLTIHPEDSLLCVQMK